jgi:hypothetical protein
MNTTVLFTETQRFRQWWIWLIVVGINALFAWGIYGQVIMGNPMGNNPMSDTGILIGAGISVVFTIFMGSLRLTTQLREDGIYVRFFPFHRAYRHYPWHTLQHVYVRTYAPLSEFGGWGLRWGWSGSGIAYNVSGNQGLQLKFNDGKKLLIGTRQPQEMEAVLQQLGQLKNP